jgi:acetyl-CoA carboxylase biotin carboxyl carrier protein
MDLKLIKALVRIMERGEVNELEIEDDKAGLKVRLKRGSGGDVGHNQAPVVNLMPGAAAMPAAPMALPSGGAPADGAPAGLAPGVEEITSPMVGTFYRASGPDSEPFVSVGAEVDEESTICIIEAMKVMNEIQSEELRGTIVEILVDDGDPVEFGQPLFLIKTR